MSVTNNYSSIQEYIKNNNHDNVKIISVSKTFPEERILPLLENGNIHFGENKVQEAQTKWPALKNKFSKVKLHMIGKLQSNKAKKAFEIFDYIHSLDNEKLANVLSEEENSKGKKIKYFIQVNVGDENQKSGISKKFLKDFFKFCTEEKKLNVLGLMAIPPNDGNEKIYFDYLRKTNESLGLNELSMGMSADFKIALKYNATFLRIGSLIFGSRV